MFVLIVQIGKEEQISVLQARLSKNTHLLHHLSKKITYLPIGPNFYILPWGCPKGFIGKWNQKDLSSSNYSNREGFYLGLLPVSKEHKMESPNIQNCYCKKDINLKTVF